MTAHPSRLTRDEAEWAEINRQRRPVPVTQRQPRRKYPNRLIVWKRGKRSQVIPKP